MELASDRRYKSFGDVLVNFLYSYHLFLAEGRVEGVRVTNRRLAALCELLGHDCPGRLGTHGKADLVEAVVAYCFLNGLLDLGQATSLARHKDFLRELFSICIQLIRQELENSDSHE